MRLIGDHGQIQFRCACEGGGVLREGMQDTPWLPHHQHPFGSLKTTPCRELADCQHKHWRMPRSGLVGDTRIGVGPAAGCGNETMPFQPPLPDGWLAADCRPTSWMDGWKLEAAPKSSMLCQDARDLRHILTDPRRPGRFPSLWVLGVFKDVAWSL